MKIISNLLMYFSYLLVLFVFMFGLENNDRAAYLIGILLTLALVNTLLDIPKAFTPEPDISKRIWLQHEHVSKANPINWFIWYGVNLVMSSLVFALPAYIVGRIIGSFL